MQSAYNINLVSVSPFRLTAFFFFFALTSCKKLVEVDPPKTRLNSTSVFHDDITATSAVYGIYSIMSSNSTSYASGSAISVTNLAGLSADELADFSQQNQASLGFENNSIATSNSYLQNFWNSFYSIIYQTNAAMENIELSEGMSDAVKKQLRGECLTLRAFSHFYACNLFGAIPIILVTDYEKNAVSARQPVADVYAQVIADLQEAIGLLDEEYPSLDDDAFTRSRARINKYAARALLARIYLYHQDWGKAEEEASAVIGNSDRYELLSDLNTVFLKNSREAVWQLRPNGNYTWDGYTFLGFYQTNNVLKKSLVLSFENNDLRKTDWIFQPSPPDSIFVPYKYKQSWASTSLTEYSMIIRLGELYLIRAEARAHQNNIEGGIEDIDQLRLRAQLPLIHDTNPGISADDLLLAIEQERRVELFTEWGHRWLDLKRTGRAMTVLGPTKPALEQTDLLYPIPPVEFTLNPNLGNQNPGY